MCNTSLHHRAFNGAVDPFSFSTFHLLRTCNSLMLPSSDIQAYYNIVKENNNNLNSANIPSISTLIERNASEIANSNDLQTCKSPLLDVIESLPIDEEDDNLKINNRKSPAEQLDSNESSSISCISLGHSSYGNKEITTNSLKHPTTQFKNDEAATILPTVMAPITMGGLPPHLSVLNNKSPLPAFEYIAPTSQHPQHAHHLPLNMGGDFPLVDLNRVGADAAGSMFPAFLHRRPRGEKRPIPEEQKDDKYFERRKRNNEAAKKSRDARKIREDRIAFRAALLEQENSILRAQVMALRDELHTMRQLMSTGGLVRGGNAPL